ncbi:MAG: sodium:glutamate symporter, partial [Clostridia bacterium]|nr:sodium:glutamate symporter [Clostridia bacterium]
GIASIEIEDLKGLFVPFILICAAGAVVTWFWLAAVCKKVYGSYYYEGLLSMFGMMTGTIGSGVLLLREIDPNYETPAANNLILGSSFGILFGAPMLVLIGIAKEGLGKALMTVGILLIYLAILIAVILLVKPKSKKD